MTQAELKFLAIVPTELRDIRAELEELNKTMAIIAKVLNERTQA